MGIFGDESEGSETITSNGSIPSGDTGQASGISTTTITDVALGYPAPLQIDIPLDVAPYREDIRRFVNAMVYKLKRNAHKGRWKDGTTKRYFELLQGEVAELSDSIDEGNLIEQLLEAADVANMALIIASIAVERGK